MSPYRRKGELTWYLSFPTGQRNERDEATYIRPTSGTRHKATADAMQAMLDLIGSRGARWTWLADAILAKRVKVPAVYDHYVSGTLDALRASLDDVDLRPMERAWDAALDRALADGTLAAETVRKYREQVKVLVGSDESAAILRSTLTAKALKAKLDAVKGSGTNKRRHAAAWSALLDFCVERGALESNPLRAMRLPKSNKAKERYAEWPHVRRLVYAMPEGAHRAACAIRHGAGLEMVAVLAMHRRDIVDTANKVVWAHGSKNDHRDRQVVVLDDECWSVFWNYVKGAGLMPDAPLFPFSARVHGDVQNDVAEALRVDEAQPVPIRSPYTLHAARSSFAVEMIRRGYELKLIASNLGHANTSLVQTLYGKFAPKADDLLRSAERTEQRSGTRGAR